MTEEKAIAILKNMNDGYTFQDCRVCVSDNKFNEKQGICESKTCEYLNAIDTVIQALKQKDKEMQDTKNEYYSLINKIENKIDKFDYEFEKAKRKNDNDRANYYWDLIGNFKKILEVVT